MNFGLGEWLFCMVIFISTIVLWSLTIYEFSPETVSCSVTAFRRKIVHTDTIRRIRIERSILDRLMGTHKVSFLSSYDRVLVQWQFVRIDKGRRTALRRISLLLAALGANDSREKPGG